ncbi:MAG TPA: tripartite tricarboxylate transporter substrate binding protein [Burkholderiales bacterium]|nr:tripartite tricarboxylate transporter substrate binding protein [Burkholderiales bacterium]
MLSTFLAVMLFTAGAQAQTYPSKTITFVVPFAAGSATDGLGRALAQEVAKEAGQNVIVENKPGANGFIAAQAAAQAAPDGHTVFITTNTTQSANPHLFKKLPYDPVKDFAPVTALAKGYQIMVVNPKLPVNSVPDVIAHAKKNPGKLTFGAGSSSSRVAVELFQQMTGTQLVHVPYKSNPLAITDLIGGQVDLMIVDVATGLPQVQGGKLKGLAVTSRQRSPLVPDLPTIDEAGVKGYEMSYWFGAYVPAKTPEPVIKRLHDLLVKAVAAEPVKKFIANTGMEPFTTTPQELAKFQATETEQWGRIIKAAGIQPE